MKMKIKKNLPAFLAILFLPFVSHAEDADVSFAAGYFFRDAAAAESGDYLKSGKVLLIVDVDDAGRGGFDSFALGENSPLAVGDFLVSSGNYYVAASFDIASSGMLEGTASGVFNVSLDSVVSTGMNIAMLFIEAEESPDGVIASAGSRYGIFTPLFVEGASGAGLSGGADWKVPSSTAEATNIYFYTVGVGGDLDNMYGVMDRTVIPEPGVFAALFGGLALCLAACRRR